MKAKIGSRKLAIVMNSGLQKHGSFEDFMIWMARSARSRNSELSFIFPAVGTPEVVRLIEAEQAKVHVVPLPWGSRAGMLALIRLLSAIRPDVADFHFCDAPQFFQVYLVCRLKGIRVVSHYHGEIRPLHLLRWKNKHLSVLRLLSLFTNRIVTVSHANKRFLEALHVAAPVEMIYNGIDTASFLRKSDPGTKPRPSTADGTVGFLYIGQLITRKQVPVLIRAFASVRKDVPRAHLTIVGGGPEEEHCKDTAGELGVADSIKFAGLISDYPFDQLQQSDVFVSASESESFGLVFPEAMCMGLPVIACRVGGIPEVVEDKLTGLLVPPCDPEALSSAMLTLARQPELRHQMGVEGRRRATERFDLADKVESTLDLFERVAAQT
jgi:glycosyltransferase involved in cell wall biosynthesis